MTNGTIPKPRDKQPHLDEIMGACGKPYTPECLDLAAEQTEHGSYRSPCSNCGKNPDNYRH